MKKVIYWGGILLVILSISFACKKKVNTLLENNNISNKSIVNYNILSFTTMEEFKNKLDELTKAIEDYDDDFLALHSNLTEDELYDLEEEIGYNEFQPLIDFETEKGFFSLRKKLADDLYVFENAEDNSGIIDPFYDIIYDEALQTLLNEKREVIVEGKTYKFNTDGSYWIIDKVDIELLKNLEHINHLDFEPMAHVVLKTDSITTDSSSTVAVNHCSCGRNKEKNKKTAGNERIKWKMKLYKGPFSGGLKMKVKGFQKKKNKWKAKRSFCQLAFGGNFCNDECEELAGNGLVNRSSKKSFKWKTSGSTKAKDNQINVTFTAVGISHTESLDIP